MPFIKKILPAVSLLMMLAGIVPFPAAAQTESPRSVGAINSRAQFDSLAVTYDPDTPYALPHLLFVIDRKDGNKIYYVNTRRYAFHKDFVNGTYLSLERGREFFENNYLKPNRRFILGTIAYQTPIKRWTFESWEGDLIPAEQIKVASDVINSSFFYPSRLQTQFNPAGGRIGEGRGTSAGFPKRNCQRAGISGP